MDEPALPTVDRSASTSRGSLATTTDAIRCAQQALAPFAPRPHWGKAFHADLFDPAAAYEMFDDFVELARRLDPHGVFRNRWWQRVMGG